jgi:Rrf2 family cysteine metabolism transcriptional repressor
MAEFNTRTDSVDVIQLMERIRRDVRERRGGDDSERQARELAESQETPLRFLEQILIQLKKAGMVESVRGASGGYSLACSPREISLARILEAVEGDVTILDSRVKPSCVLYKVWQEIEKEFVDKLDSITIEDLVRRKIRDDQVLVYHI